MDVYFPTAAGVCVYTSWCFTCSSANGCQAWRMFSYCYSEWDSSGVHNPQEKENKWNIRIVIKLFSITMMSLFLHWLFLKEQVLLFPTCHMICLTLRFVWRLMHHFQFVQNLRFVSEFFKEDKWLIDLLKGARKIYSMIKVSFSERNWCIDFFDRFILKMQGQLK